MSAMWRTEENCQQVVTHTALTEACDNKKEILESLSNNSVEIGGRFFSQLHEKGHLWLYKVYAVLWINEAENPDCLTHFEGT